MGGSRPLLSICLIVRDEEENLPRALRSVASLPAELVVVDTGSQDRTPEIARAAGARVVHHPWQGDFAAARNAGLAVARGRWIMVLDADEELVAEDAPLVVPLLRRAGVEGYICPVTNLVGNPANPDAERSEILRFWRHRPEYRWEGAIHEQIACRIAAGGKGVLARAPVRFVHYGYLDAQDAARGRKARNLALLEAAVAKDPGSAFLRFNLAVEYARLRRWAEAVDEYRRAAQGAEPHWAPKLAKGLIYALCHAGRWEEADAELERALAAYPDFTDLHFFRGLVRYQQRRYADAVASFAQAVALGPAPVPPYAGAEEGLGAWKALYCMGQAYQALGRIHEAVAAYEQAMARRPDWLPPVVATTQVLLAAGVDPPRVREWLVSRSGAGEPEARVQAAAVLAAAGAYGEALATLPAGTGGAQAHYVRGHCLLRLGRWAEAEAELARVDPGSPWGAAARAEQAYCRWAAGDAEGAHRLAQGLAPDEVARPYLEEARQVLVEALRRYPDAAVLQELLDRLAEGGPAPCRQG